jgi:flagellar biosynthesis/type III secretory pathway chaperone
MQGRVAMGMADDLMETLFREKLRLYQKLAELLKEEKKQVVGADVDVLWKMSERKQALVGDVEKNRVRILKAATAMSVDHGMTPRNFQTFRFLSLLPAEVRRSLGPLSASLMALKNEIRYISLESKQYIESKLGMIDELMSIMTGRDRQGQGGYGAKGTAAGYGRPMLIRREI